MEKIRIKTKFEWKEDLTNAKISVRGDIRVVEVKIDDRMILIPFESIDLIDFVKEEVK